ncbi:putative bifunctional diguanylate cyclase/phosphodiesterase [Anaerostipes sp.]|uniref:putative bifunctional diguanylate cyclase/phosphodiesterase n=1 Tax=Anaerostipes sp. TaxID=1872530 RepID=UPI0025C4F215|nr:bifunctional diguanylate cyclase/phosphodiesterase [Anaerostipes sp.]MBS7007768.1 GGDEF domain-containing protein [Anaerostipes sp.]
MKRWNKFLIPVFLILMILASLFSVHSIFNMQGYAKMINYLGIVRGCGQRVAKLEISGQPKDYLIDYIDDILAELSTGKGKYGLSPVHDKEYEQSLSKLTREWKEMKKKIYLVRNGADTNALLSFSEDFFDTANDAVFVAENYSNTHIKSFTRLSITLSCVAIFTWLFIVLIYFRNLFHLQKRNTNLESIAYRDDLTNASNLEKFRLDAEALLASNPLSKYAFFHLDFQNFKYCNDIFGYEFGDRLLKQYAVYLSEDMNDSETFGRISGDKFVVLRKYNFREELLARQKAVDSRMRAFALDSKEHYSITIFGGICCAEDVSSAMEIDSILDRANFAQKTVKGQEERHYAFYTDSIREQMIEEINIQSRFSDAIKDKEFLVYYQPKVNLSQDTFDSAEALVRWRTHSGDLISPAVFIPVLEKNFLISVLDQYVFREVCSFLKERIDAGAPVVPVSVNVSKIQFYNPEFLSIYSGIKEEFKIPDGLLEIEFTESVGFENTEYFLEIISQLHKHGFLCAMDDFGKGYSSLSMLKDMPIDVLKLDSLFFVNSGDSKKDLTVISGIISMVKELNIRTVAEGIEEKHQVDFLRSIGCDTVQGYYFYRPMPSDQFSLLLSENRAGRPV